MAHQLGQLTLLFALAFATSATAGVYHISVNLDTRSLIPLTNAFGFAEDGGLVLSISNVSIYKHHDSASYPTDWSHYGFFLAPMRPITLMEQDTRSCILDEGVSNLLRFTDPSLQRVVTGEAPNFTSSFMVRAGGPTDGLLYLYFASCEPDTAISFVSSIEVYSLDVHGNKDYLSISEAHLGTVYWVAFALFTACAGAWAITVWRNHRRACKLHYLMLGVVYFKALTLLSNALLTHYIQRHGSADCWETIHTVLEFCSSSLFYIVLALFGAGWSYIKPSLDRKEAAVIILIALIQTFIITASILLPTVPMIKDSPIGKVYGLFFTWRDALFLASLICCCLALLPAGWRLKRLRKAASEASDPTKRGNILAEMKLLRWVYYSAAFGYAYIMYIGVFWLTFYLTFTGQYEYLWASEAANQLVAFLFFLFMALVFRPAGSSTDDAAEHCGYTKLGPSGIDEEAAACRAPKQAPV